MSKAYIIVGLGYGDEGKGTIIDFLSRQSKNTLIVRYNGGSQAAHNVITPEGQHHTFSQFGSGMLYPTTKTHLSEYMLVNPISLMNENEGLKKLGVDDALSRLTIHKDALITTPFHQAANRIKESIYGDKLSGSCGKGIWETIIDAQKFKNPLRIGDLVDSNKTELKLQFTQFVKRLELSNIVKKSIEYDEDMQYELKILSDPHAIELCIDRYSDFIKQVKIIDSNDFENLLDNSPQIIFEGAQGMLLDVNYGFNPYTTWTNITPDNALSLLKKYNSEIKTVGILRTYMTRHGAGCFITEDNSLGLPELHNDNNRWQKNFRRGYFDLVATKYALQSVGKIDFIAMTHLDYLKKLPHKICDSYTYIGKERQLLSNYFELNDDKIIGIRQYKSEEALRQKLTSLLFDCVPNFIEVKSDYVSYIENKLSIKISLTSKGSTYLDKEWR